jgi:TPR repeat protein
MAIIYSQGAPGIEKNIPKAIELLKKAAEKGNRDAYNNIKKIAVMDATSH